MRHPIDAQAWKNFDRQYLTFTTEPHNVCLGLAIDGFNPFGNMSDSYSMWPIILVPYNMPPWKCMKERFFMMSLLILGPQASGKDIDVYLQPLIDELKYLWKKGVMTYDASKKKGLQCMQQCYGQYINFQHMELFLDGVQKVTKHVLFIIKILLHRS